MCYNNRYICTQLYNNNLKGYNQNVFGVFKIIIEAKIIRKRRNYQFNVFYFLSMNIQNCQNEKLILQNNIW